MVETKSPPRPSLSVVFPTYNEEANLERCVTEALAVLQPLFADVELIIVDDGSTDATPLLANELADRYAAVRVIHHERNRKLGRTLRTGFAAARKDLVFYTDADLPIDFNDIPRGVAAIEEGTADVVIGYRLDRCEPGYRTAYSFVYNRLIRLIFGLSVRDVNFSYKLFKAGILSKMDLASEGSFIDAEMLARAQAAGARIAEIGVRYTPRQAGQSTLARPGVIVKILVEMWRFWRGDWRDLKRREALERRRVGV